MGVKTQIEAIEKKLAINKKPEALLLGYSAAWDELTPEERQRLLDTHNHIILSRWDPKV